MADTPSTGQPARKRILWLHTQPEHYFNCMMDDLARGTEYVVPGMKVPEGGLPRFEYVAAFAERGPGWYAENAPKVAQSVFLRLGPGKAETNGKMPGAYTLLRTETRLSPQDVETICAAARPPEAAVGAGR